MKPSEPRSKRSRPALGTFLEITLPGDIEPGLATEAFELAHRLELTLSRFDERSELSRLNSLAPGAENPVSPELYGVLSLGARIERLSNRAFRLMPQCPHPQPCYALSNDRARRLEPCSFDLGGIAKGYIVDRVFEFLNERIPSGPLVVNAGGDLRARGAEPIAIRVPRLHGETSYAIELVDAAIATSSVLEGVSGTPSARYPAPAAPGKATVSVIARSCAVSDALTKALLFGEPAELERYEELGALSLLYFGPGGKLA